MKLKNSGSVRNKPIALFSPSLVGGGAERVLVNLAQGLRMRGHGVDVLLAQVAGPYLSEVPSGARIVNLRASRVLYAVPSLVRYLRSEQPKCLIAFQDHSNVAAIWSRALSRTRTPIIPTVHNSWSQVLRNATWKTEFTRWMIRSAYKRIPTVVAVSQGVAADLAEAAALRQSTIRVIYNPVITPQLFDKAAASLTHRWFGEGYNTIVAVGRLTAQKDFPTLLRAFSIVRRRSSDVRLLILGEGEERPRLEQLVRELGLATYVSLPGFCDNPYPYLRASALFVLSSAWEGLPTVLIEALALGVPIVATDCPSGPREVLEHGKYGKLVRPGDPEALAAAIEEQLRSPSPPSCAPVDQYSLDTVVHSYLDLISN